jgi:AcrR family transcriptional regulator
MAGSTRERLIDVGFDLFSRHGFHAIGLDRILTEVGVTKTTFYNHFESKDELVLEVLRYRHEWELRHFREELERLGGRNARGQLYRIFDVLDVWFNSVEFRGCLFINAAAEFPSPSDPVREVAAEHKRAFCEFLTGLAAEAGAREADFLARQISLMLEGAIVHRHVGNDVNAAKVAGRGYDLLLSQYLPPESQPAVHAAH